MARAEDVARLIHLNGGELVGKTRLQKSAYFLETLEAGFGFDFSYYHFGPYSEELSASTDDAHALALLEVCWKRSQGGAEYAVFSVRASDFAGDEIDDFRRQILNILKNYSSVELELAATAEFLKRNGYADDPWSETRRRKSSKFDDQRSARSRRLVEELNSLL